MTMNSYLMEQAAEQGGIDGIDATGLSVLLFVLTLICMSKYTVLKYIVILENKQTLDN